MKPQIISLANCPSFITKDGSSIRELLSVRNSVITQQSLAEAIVPSGVSTAKHYHPKTEEIYYILEGEGIMHLGQTVFPVKPGDAIAISPGTIHSITNSSSKDLKFLCCCSPGYEHDDTVLVE